MSQAVAPPSPAAADLTPPSVGEPPRDRSANGKAAESGDSSHERRNFLVLVAHQILFRIGWIFKTESILIPFFLDTIGGGPLVRSLLMPLARIGSSLPPALYARRLKLMPQKRWSLFGTTLATTLPFAVMSLLWASELWKAADGSVHPWTKWVFLGCYGCFFGAVGLNQLSLQTLQGKLVQAERRGRLLLFGVVLGSPLAVLAISTLMPHWLQMENGGFEWIFGATALFFTASAMTLFALREQNDSFSEPRQNGMKRMKRAVWLVVEDARFRTLAITCTLYSSAFSLFPHYQALARQTAGSEFDVRVLVAWAVTQNLAVALATLLAGPVADRFGSRHGVQLTIAGASLSPLVAIALALGAGGQAFWLVFIPLGFTPVANKMLMNYALELVDREDHALYTSAVAIYLAIPVVIGSPIVGAMVGWFGILPIFTGGAIVMAFACLQTLQLATTRDRR